MNCTEKNLESLLVSLSHGESEIPNKLLDYLSTGFYEINNALNRVLSSCIFS